MVCYSGKCQRFRHPWVVKDGWTVANRVHLKLSCLGKYIHVYFFSLYNKLTFKFDYECMRIGLSVSCQIFSSCVEASSWYIFSLAPSTLVDHQLIWKIYWILFLSNELWSVDLPHLEVGEAPPVHPVVLNVVRPGSALHSNHDSNWENTFFFHLISIYVIRFSLWYFIGEIKFCVGYLMAFVICTQGRGILVTQYPTTKTFSHLHFTWVNSTNMAGLR